MWFLFLMQLYTPCWMFNSLSFSVPLQIKTTFMKLICLLPPTQARSAWRPLPSLPVHSIPCTRSSVAEYKEKTELFYLFVTKMWSPWGAFLISYHVTASFWPFKLQLLVFSDTVVCAETAHSKLCWEVKRGALHDIRGHLCLPAIEEKKINSILKW